MDKYLKILVWPVAFVVVVIFALWLHRNSSSLKELSLNKYGVKISFYLLSAEEKGGPAGAPSQTPIDETGILKVAQETQSISLHGKEVLWVDDNPSNNEYERQALKALGVRFTLAESTSQALELIQKQEFDSIISDFKRRDDPKGAYTLLAELRRNGNEIPFIIYSGLATPDLEADAKRWGALGETDRPTTLFELVIQSLQS